MPQNNINGQQELGYIKSWLLAIRPKTLTASLSPVLLTFAFISHVESAIPSVTVFFTTIFCALLMQIGTNLVNDYFDGIQGIDTISRLGPTRVVAAGIIPARRVRFAYQICFLTAFIVGIYLMIIGGLPIVIIGFSSLIVAYTYTGGPFPLSRIGLGEFLAFLFFGPVACIGTSILLGYQNLRDIMILSMPMGFWSAALMSVNNLRDYHTDKEVKKVTLATILDEKKARLVTTLLLLMPFVSHLFSMHYLKRHWLFYSALLSLYPLLNEKNRVLKDPLSSQLNITLAQTGKSLTIYTILNSIIYFAL